MSAPSPRASSAPITSDDPASRRGHAHIASMLPAILRGVIFLAGLAAPFLVTLLAC
jgi:hypothetical protein